MISASGSSIGTAYAYRAARADGAIELGVLDADSHADAASALSARGLFPMEIRLESETASSRKKLPARDLALGLRMLATLLDSGLSMTRALSALEELVPESWCDALPSISRNVREGRSLAAAFAAAPVEFPPVVLGIVMAGEGGSGVALAVRRAAELTEQVAATRAAVIAALAYPCILAAAGTASVALLVGVVLPRFGAILTDLGQPLPTTTRIVLGVRDSGAIAAIPIVVLFVVAAFAFSRMGTHACWRAALARVPAHRRRCSAPCASPQRRRERVRRSRRCSRVACRYRRRSSTARARVETPRLAREFLPRESVVVGQGIARAMHAAQAMTATAIRLVQAGEETGRLASMLAHASVLERDLADRKLHAAVRLLEPGLILVFGGMVALVAAALLQAIYSVRPAS